MIQSNLDHIVIGAETLEQGVSYIEKMLGVTVPKGGDHLIMGTHNCLMSLGENLYFEIIAVNPDNEPPSRPRWFGLDHPVVQQQLKEQPRLLTWVVNVPDISQLEGINCFGEILTMTRGDLQWMVTVPRDGSIPGRGFLPHVIQWKTDLHPSCNMPHLGCSLVKLNIFHQYSRRFTNNLESISADRLVNIHPIDSHELPYMAAHIKTPDGDVKILNTVS